MIEHTLLLASKKHDTSSSLCHHQRAPPCAKRYSFQVGALLGEKLDDPVAPENSSSDDIWFITKLIAHGVMRLLQ